MSRGAQFRLSHERLIAAASTIVEEGRWCTLQARERSGAWETRAVIMRTLPEAAADAIEEWLQNDEATDWRLGSCTRDLRPLPKPAILCHLAARTYSTSSWWSAARAFGD